MEIESFLLCDCATDQQGKLTILGAFDTIRSNKMPALHPACTFVARIRFSKTEEGEHKIRINVTDEDGRAAGPDLEQNISIKVEEGSHSVVRRSPTTSTMSPLIICGIRCFHTLGSMPSSSLCKPRTATMTPTHHSTVTIRMIPETIAAPPTSVQKR